MIKIKDVNRNSFISFEVTRFPDGTSQAWKLTPPPELMSHIEIIWMFENEAEQITIFQLGDLLHKQFKCYPTLNCPFLPYGRQDKRIGNQSTFALSTFCKLITECGYSGIKTYDAHSDTYLVTSIEPKEFHKSVINHQIICYPDAGATQRYKHLTGDFVYCNKKRDQLTGEILGLDLELNGHTIEGKTVVIVDDICDHGGTFIAVAKALLPYKPQSIDLVVSHGLFSSGKQRLHDAGINQIFTTNSLLRNSTDYRIIDIENNLDISDFKRQERKLV